MAQAQDMLRIRSDVRPIVSKGMGTQEQLGDQSSSYYASGKHFVGNDGFIYEATKDIQVGDTISVGTLATDNCIKTDLCTVIDALDGNMPTKTSDLTNDSGFITNTVNNLVSYYLKTETYSKTEVDAIATAIKNSRFEVVATLPTTNIKTNVIYLVPTQSSTTSNVKDEYINLDGTTTGWEMIGSTSVDLSGYVTTQQLNTALASYVTSTSLSTILADYVQSSSLGTAAAKNFTDQVTSGSTDLVTSGAVSSSVQALTNQDAVFTNEISDIVNVLGAKNLCLSTILSQVKNGVTLQVESDGTMTVSTGSDGATANAIFNLNWFLKLEKGTYILSGAPRGSTSSTYYLRGFTKATSGGAAVENVLDYGEGATFTIDGTNTKGIVVEIVVMSGTVITTPLTFKPMIRSANITDDTYVPYAMTNSELTQELLNKVKKIQSIISDADSLYLSFITSNNEVYRIQFTTSTSVGYKIRMLDSSWQMIWAIT